MCLLIAVLGGLILDFNGCAATQVDSPIQHVVVIFQENRTPDNLFHDPVLISRGADIASSGTTSLGQTILLQPIHLASNYAGMNTHKAFIAMYDGGKMDGADRVPVGCLKATSNCPPPNPLFVYVNPTDVQPYFSMAEQYTFADRMFQTNQGPSFPAHQFIISGTSAPTGDSHLFAAENPPDIDDTGCTAPASQRVSLINSFGIESGSAYPCFDHETLTDSLDSAHISWRYYSPNAGSSWTAPNAIAHLCGPQNVSGQMTCTASDWTNNVVLTNTQILTDISNQNLASVSWVIPTGLASDHPAFNDGSGPSWVAQVVNAIGNSSYWGSTAIFITWDDWGGWYDHVPPPVLDDCSQWGCGYVYGFRVPLIVVSPYAKPKYISHERHDFGSILKFIEATFGLPSLRYADTPADDLGDCFDFKQVPTTFRTIAAPLDEAYFLNNKAPAIPADDD